MCVCSAGYSGVDCSEKVCPGVIVKGDERLVCSGHGECNTRKVCECAAGWAGEDCSMRACPSACSYKGFCLNGTCYCADGFTGDACEVVTCPEDCSHHGYCQVCARA
jgi:syndecan 4